MDVGTRQNDEKSLNLLLARQHISKQIGRWQVTQGLLVAVFPAIFALVLIFTAFPRPWAVLLPLVMAVLDPAVIDRRIKALTVEQAKLSEMFDCRVFDLDWDAFIAGSKPLDYDVNAITHRQKASDVSNLRDWYPVHSGMTHYQQVLEAQAATVLYDWELRKSYARFLSISAIIFFPAIFILGFVTNPNLQQFIVLLAPIIPIAGWIARELVRAADAKAKNAELYELVTGQRSANPPATEMARNAILRSVQSAIFLKRSRFPWVPFFYMRRRGELEALITKPTAV